MNAMVPFRDNAIALATDGLNVRALMKHCLSPFETAVPFEALIETIRRNSTPARRSRNQRQSAAIEIRKAVSGHVKAIRKAQHDLGVAMRQPEEICVRQVLGVMFGLFNAEPTATSEHFVDALTMELVEPDAGPAYSLPAIAAAAREMWQTEPKPPAISTFLVAVKKHQRRIDDVFQQLDDAIEASLWADDVVEPDKPVVWDEGDPDFIPF